MDIRFIVISFALHPGFIVLSRQSHWLIQHGTTCKYAKTTPIKTGHLNDFHE